MFEVKLQTTADIVNLTSMWRQMRKRIYLKYVRRARKRRYRV